MATQVLASPAADKRKASYVSVDVSTGDVVDIRGFGAFVLKVNTVLNAVATINVCESEDGTFAPLSTLGSSATALDTVPVTVDKAYDVPELSGASFLKFTGAATGVIVVMGKV